MSDIKIGKIYWFVNQAAPQKSPIGFIRGEKGGCCIIGGVSGSHCSGHDEQWNDKWKELLDCGYVRVEEAIKMGIILANWQPPQISEDDKVIIDAMLP